MLIQVQQKMDLFWTCAFQIVQILNMLLHGITSQTTKLYQSFYKMKLLPAIEICDKFSSNMAEKQEDKTTITVSSFNLNFFYAPNYLL